MARNEITFLVNLRKNEVTDSKYYGMYYPEAETKEPLSLKGFALHRTGGRTGALNDDQWGQGLTTLFLLIFETTDSWRQESVVVNDEVPSFLCPFNVL